MIFVTVGHQMPFDRLVRVVDLWVEATGRTDVFGQIGHATEKPRHFESVDFLSPREYQARMEEADAIVAHAGTGTIIAAARLGKPLLVLPRLAANGETRNDHQVATARYFEEAGYVLAAYSDEDLAGRLGDLESFRPRAVIGGSADGPLVERLRSFIFRG